MKNIGLLLLTICQVCLFLVKIFLPISWVVVLLPIEIFVGLFLLGTIIVIAAILLGAILFGLFFLVLALLTLIFTPN